MRFISLLLASTTAFSISSSLFAATLYVDLNCTSATPPYTNWSTAATNIQDAVDAANAGDLVLVTNGVYQNGGRVVYGSLTNCVAVTKSLTLRSVNGPEFTAIVGYQLPDSIRGDAAVRCVYLTTQAVMSGFTLTNGATRGAGDQNEEQSGGGAYCESGVVISNCVITRNAAGEGGGVANGLISNSRVTENIAYSGGGIFGSSTYGCTVSSNSATAHGGGAYMGSLNLCNLSYNKAQIGGGAFLSSLYGCLVISNQATYGGGLDEELRALNCTIIGNSAYQGGGVFEALGASAENSIIYYNTADSDPDHERSAILLYCCATPPGYALITNEPVFVNLIGGDFRLTTHSLCINSGADSLLRAFLSYSSFLPLNTDLDGNPRVSGGAVDIGAYELQNPTSLISYAWLQQYGLPDDGSADFVDSDGDTINNWAEWKAGTSPLDPNSVLRILSVTNSGSTNFITWQSANDDVIYYLQRSSDLLEPFLTIQSNIFDAGAVTSWRDIHAIGAGPWFYRVGVQ